MGFCLHPSLGKGQVSPPPGGMSPTLAAGWVMVSLAFQTEVQILRDEEEDALGKESREPWGLSGAPASHVPPPWLVMLVLLSP